MKEFIYNAAVGVLVILAGFLVVACEARMRRAEAKLEAIRQIVNKPIREPRPAYREKVEVGDIYAISAWLGHVEMRNAITNVLK